MNAPGHSGRRSAAVADGVADKAGDGVADGLGHAAAGGRSSGSGAGTAPAASVPALHLLALAALAAGLPADADGVEADWLRSLRGLLPRPDTGESQLPSPQSLPAVALRPRPRLDAPSAARTGGASSPAAALARQWFAQPPAADAGLHAVATSLALGPAETVATALALAVEFEPMVGRALAWLQAPVGGARPTLGLLASLGPLLGWWPDVVADTTSATTADTTPDTALITAPSKAPDTVSDQGIAAVLATLCQGPARANGLWLIDGESRPLTEQALQLPLPLAMAMRSYMPGAEATTAPNAGGAGGLDPPRLAGHANAANGLSMTLAPWPGLHWLDGTAPQPPSLQQATHDQAAALAAAGPGGVLVVRSGHPREARAAAAAVAAAVGCRAIALAGTAPAGLGPWLWLQAALPVLLADLAPGEMLSLPRWPGWAGPVLVAAGLDGQIQADGDPVAEWLLPLPLPAERCALWSARLPADAAQRLGQRHRHSASQIDQLVRSARHLARVDAGFAQQPGAAETALTEVQVLRATRQGSPGGLGSLAQWLPDAVPDDALVVSPALRTTLDALRRRCERRDGLADPLGPAARTRYRPGVRALLVGASGTGKTLSVGWLASRLGLPLYRVDLASVASKYIGETEKNLAQLFARAEHAEVVLLFDEADSLFGKRTEVKDANDRFANQQTNYLLQRIECFDGIAVLTSNSRARFDSAFTRRLDTIIDFPAPGPQERRALWLAHLGDHHALDDAQLNRIAAGCDLAGGHIRNATLAAVAATAAPVGYADLRAAIEAEYRKLGRQPPSGI